MIHSNCGKSKFAPPKFKNNSIMIHEIWKYYFAPGSGDRRFHQAVDDFIHGLVHAGENYDLVVVLLGFDTLAGDALCNLTCTPEGVCAAVRKICCLAPRSIINLEGGYAEDPSSQVEQKIHKENFLVLCEMRYLNKIRLGFFVFVWYLAFNLSNEILCEFIFFDFRVLASGARAFRVLGSGCSISDLGVGFWELYILL